MASEASYHKVLSHLEPILNQMKAEICEEVTRKIEGIVTKHLDELKEILVYESGVPGHHPGKSAARSLTGNDYGQASQEVPKKASKDPTEGDRNFFIFRDMDVQIKARLAKRSVYYVETLPVDSIQPGVCGLINLGNSSYMNCILQCLSNIPPLVRYFTEDHYLADLNPKNPQGSQGELAKALGDLLKAMWSGKNSSLTPRAFRYQMARFAPQFSGSQQHDCHELLTFLLDGLHEDLNRSSDDRFANASELDQAEDLVLASGCNTHVIDLFYGVSESEFRCINIYSCMKPVETYEPFSSLFLPVHPSMIVQGFRVLVSRSDSTLKPQVYGVVVPVSVKVEHLLLSLEKLSGLKTSQSVAAVVCGGRLRTILDPDQYMPTITELGDGQIHVWELEESVRNRRFALFGVHVELRTKQGNKQNVGTIPCIIQVPCWTLQGTDLELLKLAIADQVHRRLTSNFGAGQASFGFNRSFLSMHFTEQNGKRLDGPYLPYWNSFLSEIPSLEGEIRYVACKWYCCNMTSHDKRNTTLSYQDHPSVLELDNLYPLDLSQYLERLFCNHENFFEENPRTCPSCRRSRYSIKKTRLVTLPEILVIHLQRFSREDSDFVKHDALAKFPLKGLNMKKYLAHGKESQPSDYDLVGVCNHYGTMEEGHYTAYVKNRNDSEWYCFDDSVITPLKEEQVCTNAAYLLFYQKRQ